MPAQRSVSSASSSDYSVRPSKKAPKNKSKGIPRAKSGCYTCRIRRKKCDEKRHDEFGCTTCHRLRLQCLGFGDKRPTWLKDPSTLNDTRNKIKSFLTQQGLVKGQTNPNSRNPEDIEILVLEPGSSRSSSESPTPSLSFSVSSSHDAFRPAISSARDEIVDTPYATYNDAPTLTLEEPTPAFTITGTSHVIYGVDEYPASSTDNPALHSAYGNLYHEPLNLDTEDCSVGCVPNAMIPFTNDMSYFFDEPWQQESLKHYLETVVRKQYLMADQWVFRLIWDTLLKSKPARDGACLLSLLHQHKMTNPSGHIMTWLEGNAAGMLSKQGCSDEGEAFAALQIVSAYLFAGGRGQWLLYLDLAVDWVERLFATSQYSPEDTLSSRSELERFVIKTTMWFDVLGAVTRAQPPRLLRLFRRLFHGASIDDGQSTSTMIPIMGCEREIVLALGEISALAAWKASEIRAARLSNVHLVNVGQDIERKYLSAAAPPLSPDGGGQVADAPARCRALTSAVFRASARVYLHTVLSGDAPGCPEIAAAVTETVDALRRIPAGDAGAERAVVRMVVFSICIAGCLTDNREHRAFLLGRLKAQQAEGVGNCAEVRHVMETVWARRDRGESPSWREVMVESPEGLLLLV